MKKIFIAIVMLFLSFSIANAQTSNKEMTQNETIIKKEENQKLKKELKDSIIEIYGKENSEEIYKNVLAAIEKAILSRDIELKKEDLKRTSDWYKNEIIYMFYVDQFGIVQDDKNNTFKDIKILNEPSEKNYRSVAVRFFGFDRRKACIHSLCGVAWPFIFQCY